MNLPFSVYVADTETTGLSSELNEIIEISILHVNTDRQKTWCLKPTDYENISPDALRVNGHKSDDLKWLTAFGRETYREADKVLSEIENFFMEDGDDSSNRILVGQNAAYDLGFMQKLWAKHGLQDTFPFGTRPRIIDTMQLALVLDLVRGKREDFYNLATLVERFGGKKFKAHRAEQDTLATKDLLLAQMEAIKNFDEWKKGLEK